MSVGGAKMSKSSGSTDASRLLEFSTDESQLLHELSSMNNGTPSPVPASSTVRCDERPKTKAEESTRLGCPGLPVELEHLKIETTFINEMPPSVTGECEFFK